MCISIIQSVNPTFCNSKVDSKPSISKFRLKASPALSGKYQMSSSTLSVGIRSKVTIYNNCFVISMELAGILRPSSSGTKTMICWELSALQSWPRLAFIRKARISYKRPTEAEEKATISPVASMTSASVCDLICLGISFVRSWFGSRLRPFGS